MPSHLLRERNGIESALLSNIFCMGQWNLRRFWSGLSHKPPLVNILIFEKRKSDFAADFQSNLLRGPADLCVCVCVCVYVKVTC